MLTEDLTPSSRELSEDCVSYDKTLCNWASAFIHSAGTMARQNVANRPPNDTASHPKRCDSLSTPLQEPHISQTVLCYHLRYVPILSYVCLFVTVIPLCTIKNHIQVYFIQTAHLSKYNEHDRAHTLASSQLHHL